ncbi:RcnB family protein [Kaistia sp. MMO-174]|uniref:RcnB family protein n=1 Tax=Kaistia sp. MMO-174 TaxID=3081256 RepID=UPI001AD304DD|nr:RcnB family protein [Hyphomicrobiales bacterium]
MKKILLATIALSMLAVPAANAQSYRTDRDHRGSGGYEQQHGKQAKKPQHRKHWSKGQRVPSQYRGDRIDYKRHNLKAPPRGYQWVENDGQYLMIGIATGVIAAIANAGR